MVIKDCLKKVNLGILLDFLLLASLLIQDIDCLKLFNTPIYKYIIVLMFFILIFDFIKNKKKFKINLFFITTLLVIYLYLFIVSFCKTIIVPSIFFAVEIFTFTLYIQSKKDAKQLIKSVCKIILYSSVIIAIFSIIQFIAFKFSIKAIYEFLTQNTFYLFEGRFSSIYTEPAHLCAIICSGLFLSIFNLFIGKSKINYLYLILLLFASIITGSVIVYFSLLLFLALAYYIAIFNKKEDFKIIKKNVVVVTITIILVMTLCFTLFERNIVFSVYNKVSSLFLSNDYSVLDEEFTDIQESEFNIKNPEINLELQNKILHEQLSNASAYAIKSNMYIGIDKLKDKYILGTGMFTHMIYYDKYMQKRYPSGYLRTNYVDAGSMFLRILSEFGIVGLVFFCCFLLYLLFKGIKKQDYFLLFILVVFITQSIRLGEYNWILNCLSFIILIKYIELPKKNYMVFDFKRLVKKDE